MRKILRLLLWVAVLVASVTLCIGVFVVIAGVPSPIVRHYVGRIERTQGLRIQVNRIRWTPLHIITAHGVQVSVPDESISASFDSVELDMRSNRNGTRNSMDFRCKVSDGRVVLKKTDHIPASIDVIDCEIDSSVGSTRCAVDCSLGTGWRFTVDGRFQHDPSTREKSVAFTLGERVSTFGKAAHEILGGIDKYREQGFLPASLRARVMLDVQAGNPHGRGLWAFLDGGPVQIADLTLDQCSASIAWTDDLVKVDNFRVCSSDSGFSLEGCGEINPKSWDAAADVRVRGSSSDLVASQLLSTNQMDTAGLVGAVDAHLDVTGNLHDPAGMGVTFYAMGRDSEVADAMVELEHLRGSYSNGIVHVANLCLTSKYPVRCLPGNWPAELSRTGLRALGPLRADMSLGPAPIQAILSNMTGRVTSDRCEYLEAKLEQVALEFHRRGSEVQITDFKAVLHGESPVRTLEGHGLIQPGDGYSISLISDAEPTQLAALLPTNLTPLVASLTVHGQSHTEVTLTRAASAADLAVHATIHATDVERNGEPVDLVHASLSFSNGILQVDNLAMVRKDGQVTGQFQYEVPERLFSLDGSSSLPPLALGRFVGPALEGILAPYRIEGPALIEGKAKFGLGGNPTREAKFHVEGAQLGWRWFLADRLSLNLAIGEHAIVADDLEARWCGGNVAGALRVDKAGPTNEADRCSMDLLISGAKLASVVDVFREVGDRKPYEGTLSGQLTLSGDTGSNFLHTATGSGQIVVKEGYILSLPLLGGLSKYLSLLIPGLGYANQRDLRGTFRIRDGFLETEDAQILGKLVTIQGKGWYALENDLNIRVQVLFLKEGLTATVTRFLTSPLTKALEFELTGTTKDPSWRPLNTPDRLLKLFAEKLGGILPIKRATNGGTAHEPEPKR